MSASELPGYRRACVAKVRKPSACAPASSSDLAFRSSASCSRRSSAGASSSCLRLAARLLFLRTGLDVTRLRTGTAADALTETSGTTGPCERSACAAPEAERRSRRLNIDRGLAGGAECPSCATSTSTGDATVGCDCVLGMGTMTQHATPAANNVDLRPAHAPPRAANAMAGCASLIASSAEQRRASPLAGPVESRYAASSSSMAVARSAAARCLRSCALAIRTRD